MFLEGKELEKKFEGGEYYLDVTDKGAVLVGAKIDKDLDGYAKVKNTLEIESNIFTIAEKIAAKTNATWDDTAVASLKAILGIK